MAHIGYGYGSECHLLRWMGRHRTAFDAAVRQALGKSEGAPQWLDFLFDRKRDWADSELKGLQFLDSDVALQKDWMTWWPQGRGIQNWDAVGWWGDPSQREILLVEAKAHIAEIHSECKAKPHGGLSLIKSSLSETAIAIEVTDISAWLTDYYQLANRIAVVHFLKEHGYNPHLILVYFVGDSYSTSRKSPQRPEEWAIPLAQQKKAMGLPDSHSLSPNVHELYLHVGEKKGWLQADEKSEIILV